MSALPAEAPVYALPSTPKALVALARSFGRLRVADAATAPVLRAAAEYDRDVLPRWQRLGDGIHETAEPATYSSLLAWRSRQHWLDVVVPAALKAHPEALQGTSGASSWSVNPGTLREYLAVLSLYAHAPTGRRCIVRPDKLAVLLGKALRTVQRCQKAAEALGLYVIVTPGRMLTVDETIQARRQGSCQRGLSNEAALVVPADLERASAWAASPAHEGANVTPTRGDSTVGDLPTVTSSLGGQRRSAGRKGTSSRQLEKRGRRVYDPESMDLARGLTEHPRTPWLRGTAPGRVEVALRRFAHARIPWTPGDVADAIDQANQRNSRAGMTLDVVKNPPALLAKYLRDFDVDADHPHIDRELFERREVLTPIQRANVGRRDAARERLAGLRAAGIKAGDVVDLAAVRAQIAESQDRH